MEAALMALENTVANTTSKAIPKPATKYQALYFGLIQVIRLIQHIVEVPVRQVFKR